MSFLNRLFGSKASKEGPTRESQSARTVKDLLIARAPPWNRVPPIVITAIVEAITDNGLLEAFVMHSMNTSLVTRYEALGRENEGPEIICAQISEILCQTGSRAIPSLAKALEANQMDAATKAMMLAGDTFEAAIALAKNQVVAYEGLAAIYSMAGKIDKAQGYAKLGLSELEEMRRGPLGQSLRDGSCTVFHADMLEQAEQQLRGYLARQDEPDPFEAKLRQANKLKWGKNAEITKDGEGAAWAKRSVRFVRGKEEAVLWHKDATITLVRMHLPLDFDDFIEVEEFIAKHPREADLDDATGELKYLREMELFFIRSGYRDDIIHMKATDYEFLVAFGKLFKAGYAAGEDSVVVAAFVLSAIQFYEQDRERSINWLTRTTDDFKRAMPRDV